MSNEEKCKTAFVILKDRSSTNWENVLHQLDVLTCNYMCDIMYKTETENTLYILNCIPYYGMSFRFFMHNRSDCVYVS